MIKSLWLGFSHKVNFQYQITYTVNSKEEKIDTQFIFSQV